MSARGKKPGWQPSQDMHGHPEHRSCSLGWWGASDDDNGTAQIRRSTWISNSWREEGRQSSEEMEDRILERIDAERKLAREIALGPMPKMNPALEKAHERMAEGVVRRKTEAGHVRKPGGSGKVGPHHDIKRKRNLRKIERAKRW